MDVTNLSNNYNLVLEDLNNLLSNSKDKHYNKIIKDLIDFTNRQHISEINNHTEIPSSYKGWLIKPIAVIIKRLYYENGGWLRPENVVADFLNKDNKLKILYSKEFIKEKDYLKQRIGIKEFEELILDLDGYLRNGIPDLFVAYPSDRNVFIEVKSETDKLSRQQLEWFKDFNNKPRNAKLVLFYILQDYSHPKYINAHPKKSKAEVNELLTKINLCVPAT